MRRNVFGNLILCPNDFSNSILSEFENQKFCTILPNEDTKKGVLTSDNNLINKKGFYCIFKERKAVYLGYSNVSVRGRLGRFFAAVRGTEHEEESHAGGHKYAENYGKDFSELTVKVVEFDVEDLTIAQNITMEDVELELIYEMKPLFNSEILKINKFASL